MTETPGPGGGDRLDRIEENMLAIQEALLSVIQTTESNSQAIQQLVVNANEDRAAIRRIWEYLLEQRPNGRGGQP